MSVLDRLLSSSVFMVLATLLFAARTLAQEEV
jgi:hypothetical protein